METSPFETEISRAVWETRYRYQREGHAVDGTVLDTWKRVSHALAAVESRDRERRASEFNAMLEDFRFLPGGRILAGAATNYDVTLFNCFVMGPIEDDMESIFESLKQGALTMQQGGGEGWDFSTLRPAGTLTRRAGGIASGPVSFMRIWDSMCATLISTGFRRGAMMATLRCDHPDIETFIEAKRDPHELRNFNLSVLVSDDFMSAVARDAQWPLVFPAQSLSEADRRSRDVVLRRWSGQSAEVPCVVLRRVGARELWERIMRATYETAEPGVLFIDRINRNNNLGYREQISATNPCGEIPLPPYGACDLGSLNLTRFVRAPFGAGASLDLDALASCATLATRMLDNVIDLSRFPLPQQAQQARGTRRIGLGITGLADALIMLGLHYGEAPARTLAAKAMATVCHAAYGASIELAREKGPFPFFDRDAFLESGFARELPQPIRQAISAHGIRNSHLTAIAPAGTISLFANNISSGIEPVFDFTCQRRVREADGGYRLYRVEDFAWRHWRALHRDRAELPGYFVTAMELEPRQHLAMQAALQPYVDSAISKTINIPQEFEFEGFKSLYSEAYELGLKGCTTFRPNAITGSILARDEHEPSREPLTRCCTLERESD